MSARKLQQEMDRVFKRVGEGCAAFDLVYIKLQNASNQSQKEKHEQDLKREIKKLQKLRDQIKTWIAMNEVRDKKQLLEQRRLIENDMERFKAVEREVKTKAYSKEGLMRANDPYAKEKQEATEFIQNIVEELENQIETLEEEQDQLQNSTKRSKKDSGKQDRLNDIDHIVERHKWHIAKMEIMVSMIENDKLAPESVMDLQEDIQYYVESNQEIDFAEDEAIYDELNLVGEDENEIVETIVRDDTYSLEDLARDLSKDAAKEAALKKKEEQEKVKRDQERGKDGKKEGSAVPTAAPAVTVPLASNGPSEMQPLQSTPSTAASSNAGTPQPGPGVGHGTPISYNAPSGMNAASTSVLTSPTSSAATSTSNLIQQSPQPSSSPAYGYSNFSSASSDNIGRTPSPANRSQSPNASGINPLPPPSVPAPKLSDSYRKGAHLAQGGATAPTPMPAQRTVSGSNCVNSLVQQDVQLNLRQGAQNAAQIVQQQQQQTSTEASGATSGNGNVSLDDIIDTKLLPPGLQDLIQCLDSAKQRLADPSATFKVTSVGRLIHNSFLNTPDAQMSDLPNYYHPQNPYPTPDYYPQESLSSLEDPAVFTEMHVDTLFYIFYYCQNTHQQYLAAKELKSRSWRFHKQFLTWFQRQEDPTLITEEYEEGTYRFFDFEGSWVQRRKTNFKFEFKYLENEI